MSSRTWHKAVRVSLGATVQVLLACGTLPALTVPAQAQEGSADDAAATRQHVAATLVELCAMEPAERQASQARLLGNDPDAIEVLGAALEQSSVAMARRLAAWALGESAAEQACSLLANATDDGVDPGFSVALATARARCGDADLLRGLLDASHPEAVRLRAALTLALLEDAQARDEVFALYEEFGQSEQIAYVALAIGLYREPSTSTALEVMLRERDWRVLAAVALARQGSGAVMLDLRYGLDATDPLIREAVLRAMVERGWAGAEHIERLRNDPSGRVAAYALSVAAP